MRIPHCRLSRYLAAVCAANLVFALFPAPTAGDPELPRTGPVMVHSQSGQLLSDPPELTGSSGHALLAQQTAPETKQNGAERKKAPPMREPDVVYVPTPQKVVEKMLELAEVKPGDVVYDLGCGDGRIVVAAAKKYGVKAVGFDINPKRIRESRANVKTNNVGHLVTIRRADIFELDLREADVVTLYLLPDLNVKLMPQLKKLKPGSRIVSHDFDMRGAKPVQVLEMTVPNEPDEEDIEEGVGESDHTIYKWMVPWEMEQAAAGS